MNKKTVLIVEDEEAQRLSLKKALEFRGFHVEAARTVEEARTLGRRLGDKIDVMVLDMNLGDPANPNITGAHIGKEIVSRLKWPPESLILSAIDQRADYYKYALDLGVADYLPKSVSQLKVIRHIRALAIKGALSSRPENINKIADIAETSRNPADAVAAFSRQLLVPELEACLGAPFVVLVTAGGVTQKCGGVASLAEGARPAYGLIQSYAHGNANLSKPFVFDASMVINPEESSKEIYRQLNRAAFIPLSINRDLLLSIGILDVDQATQLTEDAVELAEVLMGYLRPAVIESTLTLLSRLTESSAERKTVLRETSKFCLFVGQEQLAILADALESKEVNSDSVFFRKLKTLATDLRATGEMLLPLAREDKKEETQAARPSVLVADMVNIAWRDVKSQFPNTDINFQIHVDELCQVEAAPDDFVLAVSRLLQWSIQRKLNTPTGELPMISVNLEKKSGRADIIFEDKSRRLGKTLRKHLFDPFTQTVSPPVLEARVSGIEDETQPKPGLYLPLYLAKMMIEMKCHGRLEDQSDLLAGNLGHRFVVNLPSPGLKAMRNSYSSAT